MTPKYSPNCDDPQKISTKSSYFSEISHEIEMIRLTETKLFHFHRIFRNGGGIQSSPPEPLLDAPPE